MDSTIHSCRVSAVGGYKLKDKHWHYLKTYFRLDRSSGTTRECMKEMMMKIPCSVNKPAKRLQVWEGPWYNMIASHKEITRTEGLKPIVKNPENHPMSSDSKEMEYRVPNPFGHIIVVEICMKTRPDVDEVRYDIVILDVKPLKNELAGFKALLH